MVTKNNNQDVLGKDLAGLYRITDGRCEDLDFAVLSRKVRGGLVNDLASVNGTDNAVQAVIHRIKTVRGELTALGHPDYGSRHHELIGRPNTEHNRNLAKLYILQALSAEPRIEKIHEARIQYDRVRSREQVEIILTLSFIGAQEPTNLIIPFNFEGGL